MYSTSIIIKTQLCLTFVLTDAWEIMGHYRFRSAFIRNSALNDVEITGRFKYGGSITNINNSQATSDSL